MRRWGLVAVAFGGCLWAVAALGAGSWVASAPAVTVAMAGRSVSSAELAPPAPELARGQRIGRVSWQYRAPSGVAVEAWLCHGGQCVELPGPRGWTEALAGRAAEMPLHFRFALGERRQRPVTLQGLRVIVNHDGQG